MTKGCDIENYKDIKENPVQVEKERCSISQKLIFNSNISSKSNAECITELKKVKINNTDTVVIATLRNSFVSKFDELKLIGILKVTGILIINKTKLDAF